jgi:cell division protein FtsQ
MKKFLRILLLIPVLYTVAIPFWMNHDTGLVACGGLNVIIRDSADYRFVSRREITMMVTEADIKYAGVPLKDIPLEEIESLITAIPELRMTEAYRTIDGTLHIEVDQRNPVLRLSTASGGEYYIDEEGYIIRKDGLYPPRVHMAKAGFDLRESQVQGKRLNYDYENSALSDLYHLVQYIRKDQFLSALIDQIEVSSRGDIALITRTGGHTVILGDIADMETKFATLVAFYKQVRPEAGWNMYRSINLKYTGQVVCRRR